MYSSHFYVISYHEWNSPLASMTFGLPNHTFSFRLCVRLQEFLMSGRLLNLVLEFVQGRALQMLRLLSSNAVVSSDQFCFCTCGSDGVSSGVATAGGRGGKPWTFGFGSPATRTGSTRHVRAGPARQRNSRAHSPRPRLTFPPPRFGGGGTGQTPAAA